MTKFTLTKEEWIDAESFMFDEKQPFWKISGPFRQIVGIIYDKSCVIKY